MARQPTSTVKDGLAPSALAAEGHAPSGTPNTSPPPAGRRTADRLVGFGLLAGGAVLMWRTFTFSPPTWDALGMAFWPRVLVGTLMVIGLVLVVRGQIGKAVAERIDWRGFAVLAGAVAYVLVMDWIGFVIATPPFLFAGVLLLSLPVTLRRIIEAGAFAAGGTIIVQILFEHLLLVSLPEGNW